VPTSVGHGNGPLLILLDINMPILDGVETLRRLKAEEATRRIPVIILTTTDDPREKSPVATSSVAVVLRDQAGGV